MGWAEKEKKKKRRARVREGRNQPPDTGTGTGTGTVLEEEDLDISQRRKNFPFYVKQQCWDKAEEVKGRDPNRWRRDALGNIVFNNLRNCSGCVCHNYDPIIPFSKGGKLTLENCQVLQIRVNRETGNQTDTSSSHCRVEERDMDLLEQLTYGNVRRDSAGGCRIQ